MKLVVREVERVSFDTFDWAKFFVRRFDWAKAKQLWLEQDHQTGKSILQQFRG